jgi:phosphonatase-like hydrolase
MQFPSLAVFDMAGTTIEDRGQVPAAFTTALSAHGIAVTAADIDRVRGAAKRHAILQFLPPGPNRADRAAVVYSAFRDELARRYAVDGVRPISGAAEAFLGLRERGAKVALTTGFDRETATLLLSSLGWLENTVDAIVCGDDVARGRPEPDLILRAMADVGVSDASVVAAIGDTTLDLQAGARAGVGWNVGVLSGAHRRAAMELEPHTHIIDSVAKLGDLWGRR